MGYSQWGHRELNMTEQLSLTFFTDSESKEEDTGRVCQCVWCSGRYGEVWGPDSPGTLQHSGRPRRG